MIQIKTQGLDELEKEFAHLGRQLPFVVRTAVNEVAFKVRDAEIQAIQKTFNRPRPRTVKNVFVQKMTKDIPFASIRFDQIYPDRWEYMESQVEGGPRPKKKSERMFGRYYVPGVGARLDSYGNISGGQITQIASVLGLAEGTAGYAMNTTARSRERNQRAKKGRSRDYFAVFSPRGGLKPGVYQRVAQGLVGRKTQQQAAHGQVAQFGQTRGKFSSVIRARGVRPVLVFSRSAPTYRKRLDYFGIGRRVVDKELRPAFLRAVEHALKTAR